MKKLLMPVWAMSLTCAFAAPMVSDLKVTSVEPLGVAIDYVVSGASENEQCALLEVSMSVKDENILAKSLSGATSCADGAHRIYWNMAKDGLALDSPKVRLTVAYRNPLYCVIDLSGGEKAGSYPVAYLNEPPSGGFTNEAYKTTKLVLRRVEPGTFSMGGSDARDNKPHDVALTKPFYMGLYEVTQKQWELVMGTGGVSLLSSHGKGDAYPAYGVAYSDIRGAARGAGWPSSSAVDASSFLGKLRAKTELGFDLPTEAQWEYACRAGTLTAYSCGDEAEDAREYMWYGANASGGANEVGTKLPNRWGFYDMHGNVWEWCLDWYSSSTPAEDEDPKGPASGIYRVKRGGGWRNSLNCCTSFYRLNYGPSFKESDYGFRLVWTLPSPSAMDAASATTEFATGRICPDGGTVDRKMSLGCAPTGDRKAVVKVNGEALLNAIEAGSWEWEAPQVGRYVISHAIGDDVMSATYRVPEWNPPVKVAGGITLPKSQVVVGASKETTVVEIKGHGVWTAEASDDWLTLSRTRGTAPMKLAVAAAENVAAEKRVGYVSVSGRKLEVTQQGRGATVANSVTVATTGEVAVVKVSVTTGTTWCASSQSQWIRVETPSGIGPGEVRIRVMPWNRTSPRKGNMTIAGQPVSVTQNAVETKIEPMSKMVEARGASLSVVVDAMPNADWTIENVPEWISLDGDVECSGSNTVTFVVSPNETFEERKATILIADKAFSVTQNAAKVEVGGTNQTANVCIECPVEGANLLVPVRVNVATASWTVEIPKDAKDNWVFLMSGDDPVAGDGTFELYVAPMPPKENERETTIKIGNVTKTIRQKRPPKGVAVKAGANDAAKPQVTGPSSTTNTVSATNNVNAT